MVTDISDGIGVTEREYQCGKSEKEHRFTTIFIGKLTEEWENYHLEHSNQLHCNIFIQEIR